MRGDDLLEEFRRRIMKERGTKSVSDSVLAQYIGVTQAQLANYRGKELTAKQIANIVEKHSKAVQREMAESAIVPIVEFLSIDPVESRRGASWKILEAVDEGGSPHPYYQGVKARLEEKHGIYIFFDSRGRAIYVGKAQRQTLWVEMNNAYNRDRGAIQNIYRVSHPERRVQYRGLELKKRQISKKQVPLHEMAIYCSAYEIPDLFIGRFEALIVRAFANDLLNVRIEML